MTRDKLIQYLMDHNNYIHLSEHRFFSRDEHAVFDSLEQFGIEFEWYDRTLWECVTFDYADVLYWTGTYTEAGWPVKKLLATNVRSFNDCRKPILDYLSRASLERERE